MRVATLRVIDEAGKIVREGKVLSCPETIAAFLKETELAFERIGFEAGQLAPWLYRGLREAGLAAVCIEARRMKAFASVSAVKTDRKDARLIAQAMRVGLSREVHVKSISRRACCVRPRKSRKGSGWPRPLWPMPNGWHFGPGPPSPCPPEPGAPKPCRDGGREDRPPRRPRNGPARPPSTRRSHKTGRITCYLRRTYRLLPISWRLERLTTQPVYVITFKSVKVYFIYMFIEKFVERARCELGLVLTCNISCCGKCR